MKKGDRILLEPIGKYGQSDYKPADAVTVLSDVGPGDVVMYTSVGIYPNWEGQDSFEVEIGIDNPEYPEWPNLVLIVSLVQRDKGTPEL